MARTAIKKSKRTKTQILEPKSYNTRGTLYIHSQRWDLLWHEFAAELAGNGHLKYPTAYAFARAKTKTLEELEWMWHAIGPRPILAEGEKPPIPWMGDFMYNRENGFWPNSEHTRAVLKMLQAQCDAAPLARGLSRVNTRALLRAEAAFDHLDAFFNGAIFDPLLDMTANATRFCFYMDCSERIHNYICVIEKAILKCHGIDLDDLNFKVMKDTAAAVGGMVGEQGGTVAVTRSTTVTAEVPGAVPAEDQSLAFRMMNMFARKARLFDQPVMGESVSAPNAFAEKPVEDKSD